MDWTRPSDQMPEVPEGQDRQFLVTVQDDSGKRFCREAVYCNRLDIGFWEGDTENLPNVKVEYSGGGDEDPVLVTGFLDFNEARYEMGYMTIHERIVAWTPWPEPLAD